MQKNYSGSIALTKLVCAIREMKGKDGKPKNCIIIPIDDNYLVEGKDDAYYLNVRVITKDEQDKYGQNGFIAQSVDSKIYKDADDNQKEEFKKLPILGSIKDFSGGGNDNSGKVDEPSALGENDDLPF